MAEELDDEQKPKKEQPIIIKKVKGGGGHGHHGGAWKVAYADFVTAMMAFFLVMWILNMSDETKKGIANYFSQPGVFNFMSGKALPVEMKLSVTNYDYAIGASKSNYKEDGSTKDKGQMFLDSAVQKVYKEAQAKSEFSKQRLEETKKQIQKEIEEIVTNQPDMGKLLNSMKIITTQEGFRIELIESEDNMFFERGNANFTPLAREVLAKIARSIGKLRNYVEIEGHTDSSPFGANATYTNWELSVDRANSARRFLANQGLWDGQIISVVGFADRKPIRPENPLDKTNRRISILVKNLNPEDFLGSENSYSNLIKTVDSSEYNRQKNQPAGVK